MFQDQFSSFFIQIYWFNMFITNLLVIIYYFCGNLFLIWQFFRQINKKIDTIFTKIVNNSKSNLLDYRKLSNEIDQMRYLYTKTISILQQNVRIYVFSLIVAILLALINLVGAVRFFYLNLNFFLLELKIRFPFKLFNFYQSVWVLIAYDYTMGWSEITVISIFLYYFVQSFNIVWMSSLTINEVKYKFFDCIPISYCSASRWKVNFSPFKNILNLSSI